MLCGIGDVRNRAAPFRGRSTGMTPEYRFENTYRSHDIRLECGVRVDPIVFHCIFDVSCCTICGVVVVATEESDWYNIMCCCCCCRVRWWSCPVFLNRVADNRSRYLIVLDTVACPLVGKHTVHFASRRSNTPVCTSVGNRRGRP